MIMVTERCYISVFNLWYVEIYVLFSVGSTVIRIHVIVYL